MVVSPFISPEVIIAALVFTIGRTLALVWVESLTSLGASPSAEPVFARLFVKCGWLW